jgi:predicted small secreted protein
MILAVLLLLMGVCLTGCQMMQGLGGDIKWSGEQIENGASNFTNK